MSKQTSKSTTIKLAMSIMIPLLIVVTAATMAGASFAWFTNADKVTVTEISMSTAKAYSVSFDLQQNALWDNMWYVGQTAFCDAGANAGKLMTKGVVEQNGGNEIDTYNRAYYFINTIALNTEGNVFDMSMTFDTAKIVKYKRNDDGSVVIKDGQKEIDAIKRTYGEGANPSSKIPYAFTWFFKESTATSSKPSTNYYNDKTGDGKTVQRLLQLNPLEGESWYTPYGKLTFGADNLVALVNDDASVNASSIADVSGREISNFFTHGVSDSSAQLFDFYIVFAPEKLFWMQFFADDRDKYTASDVYSQDDEIKNLFENLSNQMFYSSYDYSGSTFEFSAMINVTAVREEAQG